VSIATPVAGGEPRQTPGRGEIVEYSGRTDDQDVGVSVGCLMAHVEVLPLADSFVLPWPTVVRGIAVVMPVRLPVSLAPKLRVTGAEREDMPIYLRTFFRLLSGWVRKYVPTQLPIRRT